MLLVIIMLALAFIAVYCNRKAKQAYKDNIDKQYAAYAYWLQEEHGYSVEDSIAAAMIRYPRQQ